MMADPRHGLKALNFFVAAMQTGFGPFVSVWLVSQGWSLTDVGFALSAGTVAMLVIQVPGGAMIDMIHHKAGVTAVALAVLGISAALIAMAPFPATIWLAQVLHSAGSVVVSAAIAALTLSLCGHDQFGDRLGGNARYASIGSALAALVFGLAGAQFGGRGVFLITAALAIPAILSLRAIEPVEVDCEHMALVPMKQREEPLWAVYREPLMHVFAICVLLFHVANAALLPLMLGELSRNGGVSGFVVSAVVLVPQVVTAIASPKTGALAQRIGRRAVLLIGFAALPLRALLFATNPGPDALVAMQVLDGVSATVLGIMLPLIAADLTRRSGHLNLAIGSFGLAAGLGATVSNAAAGWAADHFGLTATFCALALAGVAATVLLALVMPETRPEPKARQAAALA